MSRTSRKEESKKIKLQAIFWEKGEMKKREFYFNNKEEAISESKTQFGYIKIYDEHGELCHSIHKDTKEKEHDNHGHHGHGHDETYA